MVSHHVSRFMPDEMKWITRPLLGDHRGNDPPPLRSAQGVVQAPPMQIRPAPQLLPQSPQWASSVWVSTQTPAQFESPAWQLSAQAPLEQRCPALQELEQNPQLSSSVWVFTQTPLQFVSPAWQETPQLPVLQICPALQVLPHPPQCASSVSVSTQSPPQST
jgi:hypothetical protein